MFDTHKTICSANSNLRGGCLFTFLLSLGSVFHLNSPLDSYKESIVLQFLPFQFIQKNMHGKKSFLQPMSLCKTSQFSRNSELTND